MYPCDTVIITLTHSYKTPIKGQITMLPLDPHAKAAVKSITGQGLLYMYMHKEMFLLNSRIIFLPSLLHRLHL